MVVAWCDEVFDLVDFATVEVLVFLVIECDTGSSGAKFDVSTLDPVPSIFSSLFSSEIVNTECELGDDVSTGNVGLFSIPSSTKDEVDPVIFGFQMLFVEDERFAQLGTFQNLITMNINRFFKPSFCVTLMKL